MIPIRLALRNFMPYCDNVPPLYFASIHTASIWGANGNGKSALIDAVTWALWGRARARSDDDLIHQGETEMEVELDFAVGQQAYRVIRKHARPKRRRASGRTILELQIATGNGFRSITGNSIQATQQEIIRVLHMDYPTFINSALLLQGRADEFTLASPARRKQVLADILRLSFYDELEEQAKEQAKQQENEKALAEASLREIVEQLAQKPGYEAELRQAESELSQIERVLEEQEVKLNQLRREKESLESKTAQLAQLEEQLAGTARARQHWEEQVRQHTSRIKEYEELIAQRVTIEEGYAQLTRSRELSEELNRKFRLLSALNESKHQLEMVIVQASQALLKEHALAENRVSQLEAELAKLAPLRNQLRQAEAESDQLAEKENALNKKRQASLELRTRISYLESSKARLEQEITEIEGKLRLLLTQGEARCPLCETELGVDGLKLIESKYAADQQLKSTSLKATGNELVQRRTEVGLLEGEISRQEVPLNQARAMAQSKAALFAQQIAQAEEAGKELEGKRGRLAEIEERLARKEFATSEQQALHQIESELGKLDYDPRQHEEARRRLADLEQYDAPRRRLEEADRAINDEKAALAWAEQSAQELRERLDADSQRRQTLAEELAATPQIASALAQSEAEYEALNARQKQAQETVGAAKAKLERCSQLEIKKGEKERMLTEAVREEKIYRELAQAFGKKGIQALLIETALPEIEVEANRLLARMTDNRMHVKIETQRETKKGELAETLDIHISDELGTRDYEMFSGGEAFRINFAIRIALSKLLARRAGAPLPTLIIDEGFGTQDASGLEKLKEAITSIQDDFEKILVITHIEELRDAFPTRIDVVKTAQGSTIEVN